MEAPDDEYWHVIKVAEIIGVSCLLRTSEYYDLKWDDVTVEPNRIAVKVRRSKRMAQQEILTYYIADEFLCGVVKSYINKFPPEVTITKYKLSSLLLLTMS